MYFAFGYLCTCYVPSHKTNCILPLDISVLASCNRTHTKWIVVGRFVTRPSYTNTFLPSILTERSSLIYWRPSTDPGRHPQIDHNICYGMPSFSLRLIARYCLVEVVVCCRCIFSVSELRCFRLLLSLLGSRIFTSPLLGFFITGSHLFNEPPPSFCQNTFLQ